jgi:antitoxin ParD1/3/4
MSLIKKSITVTEQQEQWVRAQIASGQYGNDSEYFRDLIRRDQEQNAKFHALKAAIREGLDSGVTNRTVPQIMEEVEARLRANGRL